MQNYLAYEMNSRISKGASDRTDATSRSRITSKFDPGGGSRRLASPTQQHEICYETNTNSNLRTNELQTIYLVQYKVHKEEDHVKQLRRKSSSSGLKLKINPKKMGQTSQQNSTISVHAKPQSLLPWPDSLA